jgi:hypothetical protein
VGCRRWPLKADVLAASVEVEGAERGGRIGRVHDERPDHAPRARKAEPVGFHPAGGSEGGPQVLQRSDQHEVDGIAGQTVAGNREAGHAFALEDLQAHADCARKDEIRRDRISDAQSQDPVQLLVDGPEDENDKPDTENAERQDQQAPQKPYQQSNDGTAPSALIAQPVCPHRDAEGRDLFPHIVPRRSSSAAHRPIGCSRPGRTRTRL